jgi:RNA polymerase sigma-70 factor (ECF subfamily)
VGADDLVQSTLARALAKRHLWQLGTTLRHWLFTILHNQRVSEVRSLVHEQRALAGDGRLAWISAATPELDGEISLLELDRAIAALPEARRQVVLLIGLEGGELQRGSGDPRTSSGNGPFAAGAPRMSLRNTFHVEAGAASPVSAEPDARSLRLAA